MTRWGDLPQLPNKLRLNERSPQNQVQYRDIIFDAFLSLTHKFPDPRHIIADVTILVDQHVNPDL
jgi:hypothetical protein